MDQFGHCGGGDHDGEGGGVAEDGGTGGDRADVAHDSGPEPDAAVEGFVGVAGDEVVGGGGVEGPCFGARGFLGGEFEVVGVDDGVEVGLGVVSGGCGLRGGGRWLEPFVVDG